MTASFVFDVDDVVAGADSVILARGPKRYVLHSLTPQQIRTLSTAARGTPWTDDDAALRAALNRVGALRSPESFQADPNSARWRPSLSSATVRRLCLPLVPLAGPTGLLMMCATVIMLLAGGWARPALLFSVTGWLKTVTLAEFGLAGLAFTLCIVLHEFGHAASCLRYTGSVGPVRARLYRGIPVFTTDVSSLYRATPRQQAAIAATGVVFQVFVSILLLTVPYQPVRVGASLSLLSAAFAIIPLPGADGYWFLNDLFRVKLVGPFGAHGRRDWVGFAYAGWLALITLFFCYILVRDAATLAWIGAGSLAADPGWALVFIAVGLYAAVIAALFLKRTGMFLMTGEVTLK